MSDKKKKNAFGWWQQFSSGNPEKNAEIFNHNMGADSASSEASGEVSGTAMAEAVNDIVNTPENNLEAMRALREENVDPSNGISYRNGRFYKGNMEVVSDNSDELPDEEEPEESEEPTKSDADKTTDKPINAKKKFIVTANGLGQVVIEADTRKAAMAKYRKQYGNTYMVIGVNEY